MVCTKSALPNFFEWKDHDAYKKAFDQLWHDFKTQSQQAADLSGVQD